MARQELQRAVGSSMAGSRPALSTLLSYSYLLKLREYWQMSWLHSKEPGNFQMHGMCEDDLSSDMKAAGFPFQI